jgi:uracil-DNA glycosylase
VKETLKISGEDVLLTSPEINNGKPLKIGELTGAVFTKHESFYDLLRKYQAWTLYEDVLDIADTFIFKVEEENGTRYPDIYSFTISRTDIIAYRKLTTSKTIKDQTGFKKIILPLSLFKVETNNESANKKIKQLGVEWYFKLRGEFHKQYMKDLSATLQQERLKYVIYPASPDVFRALRITPFSSVNVVAIGQNPYHNGLADGLSFSSLNPLVIPASLQNIFKEIENDVYGGLMLDIDPVLDRWARQGVLLINTSLTVREGDAESHFDIGWETFTSEIISKLYEVNRPIVWLLWGKQAEASFDAIIAKFGKINENHLVLRAAHPSPKSASFGFFGCKHFSKTNKFLEANNLQGITW